jgi:hypothetical protein
MMHVHRPSANGHLHCLKDGCIEEFANVRTLCNHFKGVHSAMDVTWEAADTASLSSLNKNPLVVCPTVQQGLKRSAIESSNPPVAKRSRLNPPTAVPSDPTISLPPSLPTSNPQANASGERYLAHHLMCLFLKSTLSCRSPSYFCQPYHFSPDTP